MPSWVMVVSVMGGGGGDTSAFQHRLGWKVQSFHMKQSFSVAHPIRWSACTPKRRVGGFPAVMGKRKAAGKAPLRGAASITMPVPLKIEVREVSHRPQHVHLRTRTK